MADYTDQELAAINARIQAALAADPALMAVARQAGSTRAGANPAMQQLVQGLGAKGITLPTSLYWNPTTLQSERDTSPLAGKSGVLTGLAGMAAIGLPLIGAAAGGGGGASGAIPSEFGTSAVDTVTSGAPGSAFGLNDWIKTATNIGEALSGASVGRAQGRIAEAGINQNQANAAANLYRSQLDAPGIRAGQAVRGDILANAQDANITGVSPNIPVPSISGGLRPSMFSDDTRALGRDLSSGARAAQARDGFPTAPVLPPLPEAGTLDSILNTGSTVANIAGSVPWDKIPWRKFGDLFT